MPLTLDWHDIGARLFFTVLAGALIGWNRGETGHPAGMRTTLLVCLAASVAMIEANLLLATRSKPQDSFVVLDLARYPLGILSGIGFIGAGAIIRRGSLVDGVTTAATLWFVTVVGLGFGGGQFGLGIAGTVIGFLVLTLLKHVEDYLPVDRQATVDLIVAADSPALGDLTGGFAKKGYRVIERASSIETGSARRHILYEVHWRAAPTHPAPTDWLDQLATSRGVIALAWQVGPPPAGGSRPAISRETRS